MTRKQTNDAIRRSLLLGDTRAERHGVYARRKPVPVMPLTPPVAPLHVFVLPTVTETPWSPMP